MDCEPLTGPRARYVLCYPRGNGECKNLVYSLEASGVAKLCFIGRVMIPGGIKVLGKGHSSIVVASLLDSGEVAALKILRSDSKRESLWEECRNLRIASVHGATPRPYECSDKFIVMELIWGKSLRDLMEESLLTTKHVIEALEAAYALDNAGILHKELHRPWRNVYYPYKSRKALIIDLESATKGCGNLTRLAQALFIKLAGRLSSSLIEALRGYKEQCSRHYYDEIVKELATIV